MIIVALRSNLEIWSIDEKGDERAGYMRNAVGLMTRTYKTIPFDRISDHPDVDLLSAIWSAISLLGPEIDQILSGKEDVSTADALLDIISEKGEEYRLRLTAIKNDLCQQPGCENANLQSTCVITGKVWSAVL